MTDFVTLTHALLQRAYPTGLPNTEYLAVLRVLSPHMSQRNLAEVLSEFTRRDYAFVINDVLGIDGQNISPETETTVREKLINAGLNTWLDEA
jgi:hypothetical protein